MHGVEVQGQRRLLFETGLLEGDLELFAQFGAGPRFELLLESDDARIWNLDGTETAMGARLF